MNIVCVCGARPNFMKIAPIIAACDRRPGVHAVLVHTGQHYDKRMSRLFFDELGIPEPDLNLGVGSASHAVQTADVMKRFEPVCTEHEPDWVLVVGDVNSTIACALVAAKLGIRVGHVEAGLRSFDRTMPEEINRVLTDAISDALFVTEPSALENLRNEGVSDDKIHFVGNVMIDTLRHHRAQADRSDVLDTFDLAPGAYAVLTLHRPANVDDTSTFLSILAALEVIARDQPIVFPMHPRTRGNLERAGLFERIDAMPALHVTEPLGYIDFLKLMADAALVLTDSGGIQEETTILSVPCLTLRNNTERPVTITDGTNLLAGVSTDGILAAYRKTCENPPGPNTGPALWDGRAADRIVDCLTAMMPAPVSVGV
ncbi:MAG: non-hydrolyzing UDP-N-acetylglucosamine 2-epimerase [Phycisphaerae bacterium]